MRRNGGGAGGGGDRANAQVGAVSWALGRSVPDLLKIPASARPVAPLAGLPTTAIEHGQTGRPSEHGRTRRFSGHGQIRSGSEHGQAGRAEHGQTGRLSGCGQMGRSSGPWERAQCDPHRRAAPCVVDRCRAVGERDPRCDRRWRSADGRCAGQPSACARPVSQPRATSRRRRRPCSGWRCYSRENRAKMTGNERHSIHRRSSRLGSLSLGAQTVRHPPAGGWRRWNRVGPLRLRRAWLRRAWLRRAGERPGTRASEAELRAVVAGAR